MNFLEELLLLFFFFCFFQENHDDGAQVMTNDDVLGDEIPEDQERGLKQFCYQMLKLNPGVCSLRLIFLFFSPPLFSSSSSMPALLYQTMAKIIIVSLPSLNLSIYSI